MLKEENFSIEIYLTQPQYKKFSEGKAFQASYQQIHDKDYKHGNHLVQIHLTKKAHSKLLRSIKKQKGMRFQSNEITGGSLIEKFRKGVKNAGEFAKKYLKKDLIHRAIDYGAEKLSDKIGNKDLIDKGKKYLKSKVDSHYDDNQDMDNINNDEMVGEGIVDNIKKIAKHPLVKNAIKTALNIASNDINNPTINTIAKTIKSVTGLGLKGSEEMKEKMSRLRGMRKCSKKGKGIETSKDSDSDSDDEDDDEMEGKGLKKTKLIKGSEHAKEFMKKIREMRGKGILKKEMQNTSMNDFQVGNGLRHKKDCNDCQPIISGVSKPIYIKKSKKICGGSFKELN